MEQIKLASHRAETIINKVASPLRPYLSHIGRFLLVVTFLEDALRVFMQWEDQVRYMTYYRSCPEIVAHIFLGACLTMMTLGSVMCLARWRTPIGCGFLATVVVLQTIGYGLYSYASFMLRNVSLVGGILMLLAEDMMMGKQRQRAQLFPGLPNISENERSTYFSLFGRILLVGLFAAFGLQGEHHTPARLLFIAVAAACSLMVAVGFKARYSAMLLVAITSVANVLINPWWTHHHESAERDFLRYDFFQLLSIMGGFLLLANTGPGELSLDEKKKSY